MTSLYRLTCVVASSAAFLGLLSATASAWQRKEQPPAPLQAPAGPNQKTPAPAKKDGDFTDALTLPTKREARKIIDAAGDYLKAEAWPEVCQLLQSLLEESEDVFVQVKRADASGQETQVWTSIRAEANRLLGQLPLAGLETYEVLYGARARAQLGDAKTKGDVHLLAEATLKYFHTEAGTEATTLLGTYHLDRGRPMIAALCFERVIGRLPPNKVPPLTLLKAYLAQRQLGDEAAAGVLWRQLMARAGRDGLRLGDQVVSLDQLRQEIDRRPPPQPPESQGVAMYRVNAARTGHVMGSVPYLKRRWQFSMLPPEEPTFRGAAETKKVVTDAINASERLGNSLPGFFPIAANNRLVFRTYWGLYAVDLKTGKFEWHTLTRGSLEAILGNASHRITIAGQNGWLEQFSRGGHQHHVLLENSTLGTISTDLSRVYAVDDIAVPQHPGNQQNIAIGNPGMNLSPGLSELVRQNLLRAYDLDNGKLIWEAGGPRGPQELQEAYFLGAPLPLGGKLYVLAELNGELRLVCLDPPRDEKKPGPSVVWMQTLATVQVKLGNDPGRRIQAANLAYGDGVLVCPTNAGAVLGVDLLSHSLLWAYPYREGQATVMQGTRNFGRPVPALPVKAPEWKASAPVIQDGRVVFTAPDAASIHCVRLRDGTRLWKESRGDDLYLAGVFKDKVVLVGKTHCRALHAMTGAPLWNLEVGQPAGQGVGSGSTYFLPVKRPTPGVVKIDLDRGRIVSHSRCRDDEALGNLIFHDGDVISQNEQWVRAYPQLEAEIARLDREIAANPTNPAHLAERGELRLDHGNLKGAIADLSQALTNNPPESLVPKTRDKLYDTLTELLQRDFPAAEPYLPQYERLCAITVPANADEKTKSEAKEKERLRRANYWCLLAKGRENQGRVEEAFKAYLEYGSLAGPGELLPVVGQPGVRARPDVWAHGRIVALLEKAGPGPRQALEGEIAQRWEKVKKDGDTATLRSFVNTFGSLSAAAGREGRFQLAERLLEDNQFLEAELQLVQLHRQQADAGMAARAVEALARLMLKKAAADKELLPDAAYYYRQLGQEYAAAPIRSGRTGRDFFNDAAADRPRLLPHLDGTAAGFPAGRLKVREIPGSFAQSQAQMMHTLQPRGEVLPFHERLRLGISMVNYHQLRMVDRDSGEERWSQMLEPTNPNYLYNNPSVRPPVYLNGHMAVVFLGHMVYGVDLVNHKKLWSRSLLGNEPWTRQAGIFLDDDGLYLAGGTGGQAGTQERLGAVGAVTPGYVVLLTREGLIAVEPASGSVLWSKADVPARTLVFGDDEYVFLVDIREGGGTTARALRGRDGAAVEVPDFATAFRGKTRPRYCGRHLLITETEKEQLVVRLYDIRTGKDLWKKTCAANSIMLRSESPELTGVLEPNGAVTLLNLRLGRVVLQPDMVRPDHGATLAGLPGVGFPANVPWAGLRLISQPGKPATVQASHMKERVQDALLLVDADQYYLVLNDAAHNPNQNVRPLGPWANVQNTLRHTAVSGTLYAFHKTRATVNWYRDLPAQMLLLERFDELPAFIFTARVNKLLNQGGNVQTVSTLSLDKRTGKLIFDKDSYANSMFHALKVDRRAGIVDLVSHNLTLRYYLEGSDAGAAGVGGGGAGAAPAPAARPARVPVRAKAQVIQE